MKFILLGDEIYANANVMGLCEQFNWKYCFSLKENLPTLLVEAQGQLGKKNLVVHIPKADVRQELRWCENLIHDGNRCHVLSCHETSPEKDGEMKTTPFLWVTNLHPSRNRIVEMVRETGRKRLAELLSAYPARPHDHATGDQDRCHPQTTIPPG